MEAIVKSMWPQGVQKWLLESHSWSERELQLLRSCTNSARRGSFIRHRFLARRTSCESVVMHCNGQVFPFLFFHISAHHKANQQCTVFPALGATKAPGAGKGKAVPAMSLSPGTLLGTERSHNPVLSYENREEKTFLSRMIFEGRYK